MKTITTLRALAVAAVLTAGVGTAATAADGPAHDRTGDRTSSASAVVAPQSGSTTAGRTPTSVENQAGILIEAYGEQDTTPVAVYLYENTLYGNSLQVVLDAEQDLIGSIEQEAPFVVDGVVDVTLDVQGREVVLSGTVADSGESAREVDPQQDGGEQIVTRGTHTPLLADLTLTIDGIGVPLEAAPAFSYDLEVRKVVLHGR